MPGLKQVCRSIGCMALAFSLPLAADSLRARCGYAESPDAQPTGLTSCMFSQRQGYIRISRGDELLHDFSPDGDTPGTYLDSDGQRVYRKRGLGDSGQLFQLPGRFLYVLWDAAPSQLECARDALTAPATCALGDGNTGFRLQATSGGSLNSLTITPIGLELDDQPQTVDIDGTAYLAELADLNVDGWPEVYVYVSSAGSGSYGSLFALSVNNGKSASPIHLPALDEAARAGYQGHDQFRVVENRLVRRFPIYAEGDTNAAPSGGTRQIQYRLVAGEAGWQLAEDKVVEY